MLIVLFKNNDSQSRSLSSDEKRCSEGEQRLRLLVPHIWQNTCISVSWKKQEDLEQNQREFTVT